VSRRATAVRLLPALLLAACDGTAKPLYHPVAYAAESRHDFGALWIGEVRRHEFVVENRGDQLLHLDPVRSNCGCLVAKLEPKEIAPGGKCVVTAEFHADKGPATLEKRISIGTNDPAVEWLTFDLRAETKPLYDFAPPLIEWPELVLGDATTIAIPVRVADGTPVKFGAPAKLDPGFVATVKESTATGATIELRFEGVARPWRSLFHVVVPTDHPRVGELRIPVQAVVLPRLRADPPDRLDFGDVPRAAGATHHATIRHRGREALSVAPTVTVEAGFGGAGETAALPAVTASLTATVPGREWRLDAVVAPGATGSALVGRLVVRLDLPGEPPLTLTLTGRLRDG
jgi:hypothetical protein